MRIKESQMVHKMYGFDSMAQMQTLRPRPDRSRSRYTGYDYLNMQWYDEFPEIPDIPLDERFADFSKRLDAHFLVLFHFPYCQTSYPVR